LPAPSELVELREKTALVTGASGGVGRAIAVRLAAEGVTVGLTGRSSERLEAAEAAANGVGPRSFSVVADLSNEEDVERLRSRLHATVEGLDVLVHCAGTIGHGPVHTAEVAELDRQYRANLRGAYAVTQSLLPMLEARRGQVVFINSSAGLDAGPQSGAYAATKAGLKAIADSLRGEVNEDGIRVLSVFLGRTATPMQETVCAYEGRPYKPEQLIQPADVAEMVISALRLPATAEVTEIRIRPAMKPS